MCRKGSGEMGITIHLFAMIISFIIAVVYLLDGMANCKDEWCKEDTVCAVSLTLCVSLVVLFIVGQFNVGKQEWKVSENPYQTDYIVSLNDESQTNGRFYLRHGYIEENMYYQYMILRSDGGYSYGKAREDVSTIYVSDNDFRVEWYTKERNWLWFEEEKTFCKIYVPKGCIKEEYNIDLE